MTGKIRVLVADDEALVRDGLRAIAELEGDIEIVADAGTGGEAVQLARTLSPDVVLMDIRMPGMDGLAATRAIIREPGPPRVIVLTIFDTDEFVYQAMKAGASGFLPRAAAQAQGCHGAVRCMCGLGRAILDKSLNRPAGPARRPQLQLPATAADPGQASQTQP